MEDIKEQVESSIQSLQDALAQEKLAKVEMQNRIEIVEDRLRFEEEFRKNLEAEKEEAGQHVKSGETIPFHPFYSYHLIRKTKKKTEGEICYREYP